MRFLRPKQKLKNIRKGNKNQPIKIIIPPKKTKISPRMPAKTKKLRTIAPTNREKRLETTTSKYFPKSKPPLYDQVYLRQGANKVFKSKEMEKKCRLNHKKFFQAFLIFRGPSTKYQLIPWERILFDIIPIIFFNYTTKPKVSTNEDANFKNLGVKLLTEELSS